MKKYSLFLLMLFVVLLPASAQMSDQQAMKFIQQEMKAGTC